jgi:hypothetical protein
MWTLLVGAETPNPTLLPVMTKSPDAYWPPITVLFANTSKIGKPPMLFTDIKELLKSSVTLNSLPPVPWTSKTSVAPEKFIPNLPLR